MILQKTILLRLEVEEERMKMTIPETVL
jgi:hypothetical protein